MVHLYNYKNTDRLPNSLFSFAHFTQCLTFLYISTATYRSDLMDPPWLYRVGTQFDQIGRDRVSTYTYFKTVKTSVNVVTFVMSVCYVSLLWMCVNSTYGHFNLY